MRSCTTECRRDFLKTTVAGGLAVMMASRFARAAQAQAAAPAAPAAPAAAGGPPKVVITNGGERTANVINALKPLEKEIKAAIGNRRVIIKPNNVSTSNQLAASHAGALDGICDFLKSIGKLDNAVIAESALGVTMDAFRNFGYIKIAEKYNIKTMDLDQDKVATVMALNENDARPHPVRVSSMMLDQVNNFIISACMLKTHDRVLCTMGIKNIVVGSALKSGGGYGGARMGSGAAFNNFNDKNIIHGGEACIGININLAMLAPMLHPSLTVIDGYQGMEGDGPLGGSPVDHKVCVASLDYLAADVVGAGLMGVGIGDLGYLSYLATSKVGESDMNKMDIIGEPVAKLARKYRWNRNSNIQLQWKTARRVTAA
jgi:uncharacterized protein (DUF362 family)